MVGEQRLADQVALTTRLITRWLTVDGASEARVTASDEVLSPHVSWEQVDAKAEVFRFLMTSGEPLAIFGRFNINSPNQPLARVSLSIGRREIGRAHV